MTHALAQPLRELQGKCVAEEATGVPQRGKYLRRMYTRDGNGIAPIIAQRELRNGQVIEVPNAGAGSYAAFFECMGFRSTETVDTSSSAGDWSFLLKDKDGTWRIGFQTNRYPYYGMAYTVSALSFDSQDAALSAFS